MGAPARPGLRWDGRIRLSEQNAARSFWKLHKSRSPGRIRPGTCGARLLHPRFSFVILCVLRGFRFMSIAENIAQVRERIAAVARRAGRNSEEITLMGVSKTFPVERIREAYAAGLRLF